MKGLTILVIGGAGFIGRHVCRLLSSRGHIVRVVDALTGYHEGVPPSDLTCQAFTIKRCGEIGPDELNGLDAIVHLASKQDYTPDLTAYVQTNVAEVAHLFEAGAENIPVFVLVSSQAVYGSATVPYTCKPRSISQLPQPRNQYGLTKLMQEQVCAAFHRGVLKVIRPSIVVGEGQSAANLYSGLIRNTVARLAAGLPPMIYGDGLQTRDFVSVTDLARVIARAVEEPDSLPSLLNAVSCEGPVTVRFVVERIQKIMDVAIQPVVNKFERVADWGQRHVNSACDLPSEFGPCVTGSALELAVRSFLSDPKLPSREQILSLDRKLVDMGAVRPTSQSGATGESQTTSRGFFVEIGFGRELERRCSRIVSRVTHSRHIKQRRRWIT